MAEAAGVHLERELATMNFAGLHRLDLDYEDRKYRMPILAPL